MRERESVAVLRLYNEMLHFERVQINAGVLEQSVVCHSERQFIARSPGGGRSRAERFKASSLAASADGSVGDEADVSDFAGGVALTAQEAAVHNRACADAGSHCEINDILKAASGSEFPFGERGRIRVVVDDNLSAREGEAQRLSERDAFPTWHVWDISNPPGFNIIRAAEADADRFRSFFFGESARHIDDIAQYSVRSAIGIGRSDRFLKNASRRVGECGRQFCASDIDADNIHCVPFNDSAVHATEF